jgi:probable rRNA maturation factor
MLEVELVNRQRRRRIPGARLKRVLLRAARRLRVSGSVTLVFTADRAMRTLNARYRRKDKTTDVLTFPGDVVHAGAVARGRGGVRRSAPASLTLGDVVISVPAAERNARRYGRALEQELDVLALHGFLHALGYDHETDDGRMERLELRLRRQLPA